MAPTTQVAQRDCTPRWQPLSGSRASKYGQFSPNCADSANSCRTLALVLPRGSRQKTHLSEIFQPNRRFGDCGPPWCPRKSAEYSTIERAANAQEDVEKAVFGIHDYLNLGTTPILFTPTCRPAGPGASAAATGAVGIAHHVPGSGNTGPLPPTRLGSGLI